MDLIGKGGRVRTVPVPDWVKAAVDDWTRAAGIVENRLFRSIRKNGAVWGEGLTQNVIWYVVRDAAKRVGIDRLAPHDLRRSCARMCHLAGGELEQMQFLLGHASVQTTERYLGCKQRIRQAVNDRIELQLEIHACVPHYRSEGLFSTAISSARSPSLAPLRRHADSTDKWIASDWPTRQ